MTKREVRQLLEERRYLVKMGTPDESGGDQGREIELEGIRLFLHTDILCENRMPDQASARRWARQTVLRFRIIMMMKTGSAAMPSGHRFSLL
ncbi:hypothetical protein [Candidatus Desulforudis audaxviator]|uniref:hypothetical protein n=1 Tax=Candidatus Desulforudis audaxviator TaxID=471827 RepID=UPI0005A047DE|nr:hypothetical protein [Candidatus Desulforudis audaxviator]AZK59182.1 hypothetical protein Daudx_0629 [Candidatus Desulforudis audaxviator]